MKREPRPDNARVRSPHGEYVNLEPDDNHRTVAVWLWWPPELAANPDGHPGESGSVRLDLPGVLSLIDLLSGMVPYLSRGYAADHVTEAARAAADSAGEHLALVVPMSGRARPPADDPPPPDGG